MQSSCVCFSEQEVGRAGKQTSTSLFMGLVTSQVLGFTSYKKPVGKLMLVNLDYMSTPTMPFLFMALIT